MRADESAFREQLREAVRLNLAAHANAPVGVLLSGGIDSSSVANLARQQSPGRIRTFCMAMEDASLNEGDAARAFAAAIGTFAEIAADDVEQEEQHDGRDQRGHGGRPEQLLRRPLL